MSPRPSILHSPRTFDTVAMIASGEGLHGIFRSSLRPVLRAIGLSLGPEARTILYMRGPRDVAEALTGYVIAREMPIEEGTSGIAPRLLKESLFAADRDFADGTARLALVFAGAFSAGIREIQAGAAAGRLGEQMARLAERTGQLIDEARLPHVDLAGVGRSSGLSEAMAEKLAALVQEIGVDATVDVKENDKRGVEITKADGFVIDVRPIGAEPALALSSASVLVADEIIQDFGPLAAVLEGFASKRRALVIVARDITGAALAALKRNQQADVATVAAFQPSDAGQRAADVLEDLAVATGATLVADRFGTKVDSLRPAMLGQCGTFRFERGRAIFIDPRGKAEDIAFRRKILLAEAHKARHLSLDREVLDRRRSRLGGQWCELRLAGETEQSTASLVTSSRAAVRSMQSAFARGVVPGGGEIFEALASHLEALDGGGVEIAATRTAVAGLRVISRQLATNAGPRHRQGASGEVVQDPTELTKAVVDQAFSLATVFLRTGGAIAR